MAVNGYKFTALTGGGAGALDARDGTALGEGDIAIVTASGVLYIYQLSATSGATESSPNIIAPDTNAGTKRWLIQQVPQTNTVPIGTIVAWMYGYYTNGSNAGYTTAVTSTIAAYNALLNSMGFYVCDGAALNLSGSPLYNGAGRYLPNLTGAIYLQGDGGPGSLGGRNADYHTHTTGDFTLTNNEMPNHSHGYSANTSDAYGSATVARHIYDDNATKYTDAVGGGAAHNHGSTSTPSLVENRPNFITCVYIQKVI